MLTGIAPIVPPPLGKGASVAVVAPSSPFDRSLVLRGMAFLGEHFRVQFDRGMFAREGYLAGSDERRLEELQRWLDDASVGAVFCARGGYGLLRIAHRLDFTGLRRRPKWLVGFSDTTTLHLEALGAGVATLHADNVGALGRANERARLALLRALARPTEQRTLAGLECAAPGVASGPLVGGNLSLLATAATAGRLRLPSGALLALEDVTEQAYRIDRMLTALTLGGHLDRVAGVVAGDFTDCPASSGIEAAHVVRAWLATLRVPAASGLLFGHGLVNEPLPFGVPARLDAGAGTLTLWP